MGRLWMLFLSLLCHICMEAQTMKRFDFKEYLSFNSITSITQDTLGVMWIGSDNGVSQFDGYSLWPLQLQGASHRPYVNFLSHEESTLYVGTHEGLYVRYFSKAACALCSPLLKGKNIIAYKRVGKWRVVATDREVFLFDAQWVLRRKIPVYKEALGNHITCMETVADGEILVGTEAGLIRIQADGNGSMETFFGGHKIMQLFVDSHGQLWMCKGEEVLCGKMKDGHVSSCLKGMRHVAYNHEVISFLETDGQVWIGTRGHGISICSVEEGGKTMLKAPLYVDRNGDDELKNTIQAMYKDGMSRIWICTLDGLSLYTKANSDFRTIRHVNGERNTLSSNIISSIYCDGNDGLWLATSNGINRIEWKPGTDYSITKYTDGRNANDLMAGNKMQCITRVRENIFLISTKNNIKFFDSKKAVFFEDHALNKTLEQYGMRYVRSVFKDGRNNIWLAFSEGGVGYIHAADGKFRRLTFPEKLKDKHRAVCRDAQGNLWLASDNGGLYRMKLNEKLEVADTRLYPKSMFGNSWITTLYADHQKRIWVGTSSGLYRLDAEADCFLPVSFPYSRKSSYIGGIIQDKMENIWAVSLYGVYKINLEDLVVYHELNSDEAIMKTWYILGLAMNRKGEIFIGGVNGLNYFNPVELSPDEDAHDIYISNVRMSPEKEPGGGETDKVRQVNQTGSLSLPYGNSQVSIYFSSLHYDDPMKIEYAYKLEGHDKDWVITGALKNYATYSDLKPGTYVFKVKSTNASGIWMDNVRSIRVEMRRAPWQTWWAYVLYAMVAMAVLLLVTKVFNLSAKLRHRDALSKWKLNYYAHLSYGLKIPLTLVYAPLQYLLKNLEQMPAADVKQMLKTMQKNVFNLSAQVDRLSEFKKVPLGEYELRLSEADGVWMVKEVYGLFADEFGNSHVTGHLEGNVDSVTIVADMTKMEVALYNIMEDAVEFARGGGSIRIKYAVDSSDYRFRIVVKAWRGTAGTGKEQEWNARCLIASDYLKIHHGKLVVNNAADASVREYAVEILLGTSHYSLNELNTLKAEPPASMLPLMKLSDKSLADNRLDVDANQALPLVYLYGEDKETALFVRSVLQKCYRVVLASAAVDVKKLMDKLPSLVIFDVAKEEDYKFGLCQEMKSYLLLSSVPVVFISSLPSDVAEQKAYEVGADIFLTKPFNVSLLEARIKQLIDVRETIKDNIRKELIVNPKEVLVTSDDDKFLANVMNVIEENLMEADFNTDKLAERLNISRSTLYRRATEITGQSPSTWIRTRRMQRAAELLGQTEYTVSEVCYRVGYTDQRYFGQCFKKEYGMTPKQYSILKKKS